MIGRRPLLKGILGAMSTPRRPDQRYDPPAPAVGPGGRAGIFRGRLVVIFGTSSNGSTGLFVYSGTPANGNLIASITSASGTDQYGNAYKQGITSYLPAAGTAVQLLNGSANFFSNSTTSQPGSVGESSSTDRLVITSGQGTGHNASNLFLAASATATVGTADLEVSQFLIAPVNTTPTTATLVEIQGTLGLQNATAPAAVAGFAEPFASGGALLFVDGTDTNQYDTGRLTLITNGATINSSTVRVVVFTHHLGIGTYEIDIWMVTTNTTAADGAAWSFAVTGGMVATGTFDFTSMTSGTAVVGYGAATVLTTTFNGQGVAGNQLVHVRAVVNVTTAGTLTYGGLELVSGNTVTVLANGRMRICRVVAT